MAKKKKTKHRLTLASEAKVVARQHTKPCHDCPWRPESLPGWLAGLTPEQWLLMANGDGRMECHALKLADGKLECAGAAIFRRNVCKVPRDPSLLTLPADRVRVFATPMAFLEHHKRESCSMDDNDGDEAPDED